MSNPHTSIPDYAGAIIYNPDSRKVLLQKRDSRAPNNPNRWSLFGGALEASEAPRDGLIRELREELSLVIEPEKVSPYRDYDNNKGNHRNVFIFETRLEKSAMSLAEGEDFDWFSLDEALKLDLSPSTRKDLEYFKNDFNL